MKSWIFISGWNNRKRNRARYSAWLFLFYLLTATVSAEDEDAMFDEAFLEFLGSWETADGEWIEPEELESMPLSKSGKQQRSETDEAEKDE